MSQFSGCAMNPDALTEPEASHYLAAQFAGLRQFPLDGALLAFDRNSGLSALCDGPATGHLKQRAPRVVLFGITNRCNFSCGYCSRSLDAASSWTAPEAFDVLSGLAERGVMEVAFGGGEPLAFPGFDSLVQRLHDETPLAVGFTTNGALLNEQRLSLMSGKVSQIRVSLHTDQEKAAWRALRMLSASSVRFGVNVLVTPDVLLRFEDLVFDLLALGCRDLLLLSYNGPDSAMHLDSEQALDLGRRVAILAPALAARLRFGLGGCWGDRLGAVARLETRTGCGAGTDFITVTSDRRVQACSFHHQSFPVRTADDVIDVWRAQRSALAAPADVRGCTRLAIIEPLSTLAEPVTMRPARIRVFQSFASNNSGVYSLLGSFKKLESLAEVVAVLRQFAEAQAAWQDTAQGTAEAPLSPLALLCEREGLSPPDDAEAWDYDFSQVTVESIGHQIFVHSPSTITMPSTLAEPIARKGGRVSIEIDHAHHPVVATFAFWRPGAYQRNDREERQREHAELRGEIDPIAEQLRKPEYGEGLGLAPAWRDDDYGITLGIVTHALPSAVAQLREIAARRGFNVVLHVFEALSEHGDPLAELRCRNPPTSGRFQVILWRAGSDPTRVMLELRAATGCALDEVKHLLQSAPAVVLQGIAEAAARELAQRLVNAGAEAEALGPSDFIAKAAGLD